jgi:hypothetical protein
VKKIKIDAQPEEYVSFFSKRDFSVFAWHEKTRRTDAIPLPSDDTT